MIPIIYCLMLIGLSEAHQQTSAEFEDYCKFHEDTHLSCSQHLPNINQLDDVTVLELSDLQWKDLDLNYIFQKFPNVQNVSVSNSTINYIIDPKNVTKVKVLELRWLKITYISKNMIKKMPQLQILNLQYNFLGKIDSKISFKKLKEVYLAGNRWNCSKNLDWIWRLNASRVKDLDKVACFGEPYPNLPVLTISKFKREMNMGCPRNCSCTLPRVVMIPDTNILEPIISVNCSYRGLTELPESFPAKTRILHLEGNRIKNLMTLRKNLIYRSIFDLYLDGNNIESIEDLEGSYWLTHFRVFSLSSNKLTELPIYALDNALEQNVNMPNAVKITLGGNPWRCDCIFTPVFQEMLLKFIGQVKDVQDVKCSYVEGDENSLMPIKELSRSSVCRTASGYSIQEFLDLLNVALAGSIVFILGKLAYDYYHFKKTGRLPWIITKMP